MASYRLAIRRDLAANWTSTDPVLAQGEFGFETDTLLLKIGDGVTAWTALGYYDPNPAIGTGGSLVGSFKYDSNYPMSSAGRFGFDSTSGPSITAMDISVISLNDFVWTGIADRVLPIGTQFIAVQKNDSTRWVHVEVTSGFTNNTTHYTYSVTYVDEGPGGFPSSGKECIVELVQPRQANIEDLDNVTVTTPSVGQVLEYDGAEWVNANNNAVYGDTDVNSHLNVITASAGDVLEWDGADYTWAAPTAVPTDLASLTDTTITTPANGEVLQYNGAAWVNATAPAGYTDADVDTHLNTGTATDGQILSYTSGDYDWIDAPSGGSDPMVKSNPDTTAASATGIDALAVGSASVANSLRATAVGVEATAGSRGNAFGNTSTAGTEAVALGQNAKAAGNGAVTIGTFAGNASNTGASNVLIGDTAGGGATVRNNALAISSTGVDFTIPEDGYMLLQTDDAKIEYTATNGFVFTEDVGGAATTYDLSSLGGGGGIPTTQTGAAAASITTLYNIDAGIAYNTKGNGCGFFVGPDNTEQSGFATSYRLGGSTGVSVPYHGGIFHYQGVQTVVAGRNGCGISVNGADLKLSASDFALYTNNTTPKFKVTTGGAVTINNAFTFPTADGTSGQVLETDGAGNVTWATPSGGGGLTNESASGTTLQVTDGTSTATSSAQAVHVGLSAKGGTETVAYGYQAGNNSSDRSVAVGTTAGSGTSNNDCVLIGHDVGNSGAGANTTAVGAEAAKNTLGTGVVAVGYKAAEFNAGHFAIAVGYQAASSSAPANSVCLSARGLSATTPSAEGDIVIETDDARLTCDATDGFGITTDLAGTPQTATMNPDTGVYVFPNLPTSDPVNAGQLWNDAGTLKVSAG